MTCVSELICSWVAWMKFVVTLWRGKGRGLLIGLAVILDFSCFLCVFACFPAFICGGVLSVAVVVGFLSSWCYRMVFSKFPLLSLLVGSSTCLWHMIRLVVIWLLHFCMRSCVRKLSSVWLSERRPNRKKLEADTVNTYYCGVIKKWFLVGWCCWVEWVVQGTISSVGLDMYDGCAAESKTHLPCGTVSIVEIRGPPNRLNKLNRVGFTVSHIQAKIPQPPFTSPYTSPHSSTTSMPILHTSVYLSRTIFHTLPSSSNFPL